MNCYYWYLLAWFFMHRSSVNYCPLLLWLCKCGRFFLSCVWIIFDSDELALNIRATFTARMFLFDHHLLLCDEYWADVHCNVSFWSLEVFKNTQIDKFSFSRHRVNTRRDKRVWLNGKFDYFSINRYFLCLLTDHPEFGYSHSTNYAWQYVGELVKVLF